MGFRLTENGEKTVYGKVAYVADTPTDIAKLPVKDAPGSTCFVISNSSVYMLNTQKQWVEI